MSHIKNLFFDELNRALVPLEQAHPVAWQVMVEDEAMKEFPIKDMAHDWCVHQKLSGSSYSYWIRPLYTSPPVASNDTSQHRVDETAKQRHEPVIDKAAAIRIATALGWTPPRQPWVGLTDEDKQIAFDDTQEGGGFWEFADAIEATLRKKNHG